MTLQKLLSLPVNKWNNSILEQFGGYKMTSEQIRHKENFECYRSRLNGVISPSFSEKEFLTQSRVHPRSAAVRNLQY